MLKFFMAKEFTNMKFMRTSSRDERAEKETLGIPREVLLALLIISAIGAIPSLIVLYHSHMVPLVELRKKVLASYSHSALYEYVVFLKPNFIYNTTELKSSEKPIYLRITDYLRLYFKYTFSIDRPSNTSVKYSIIVYLESPVGWSKLVDVVESGVVNSGRGVVRINSTFEVHPDAYWKLIDIIERETGTSSRSYTIKIVPRIEVFSLIDGRELKEVFTPTLTINMILGGPKGDVITLEGLEHERKDRLIERYYVRREDILFNRKLSYTLLAVFLPMLGFSTFGILKERPKVKPAPEKKLASVEDLVVEASKEIVIPSIATVEVASIEDLIKISDIMGKPIVKYTKRVRGRVKTILCVLDSAIIYKYEY